MRILSGFLLLILAACQPDTEMMVGTLERDRVEIAAESNEPITEIYAQEGETVDQHNPLVQQSEERILNRIQQLQAEKDRFDARLAELVRGPRNEDILGARAELEGSTAMMNNARATLDRARDIYQRGLSSKSVLDDAEARFSESEAKVQADTARLEQLLNGTTSEELSQAEAQLNAAVAALEGAYIDQQRLQLQAPVNATVDDILYEPGERPRVGDTVVVLIADQTPWARIYIPQSLRPEIRVGTRLSIQIDGIESAYTGTVRRVSADPSFTPYFALTEHDRSRLSYLAEVDIPQAQALPSGLALSAYLPPDGQE